MSSCKYSTITSVRTHIARHHWYDGQKKNGVSDNPRVGEYIRSQGREHFEMSVSVEWAFSYRWVLTGPRNILQIR